MRFRRLNTILFATACMTGLAAAPAARPEMLELHVGDSIYRGKTVAHDDAVCWLMERDGSLHQVEIERVREFRTVAPRLQALPAIELRERVRREFGREFEVATSQHYLVCSAPGKAAKYAAAFEQVYRLVHDRFSACGLRISPPEFPLVAIVFPDRRRFAEYAQQNEVRLFPDLTGYYHRITNRIVVVEGEALEPTIVHETVHQLAFNAGLHSRIGQDPLWAIEGLATVLEAPGTESRSGHGPAETRINRDRFLHFREFVESRREPKSLVLFLSDDSMFEAAPLDAYAQAWALTFYLVETRSEKYAKYLKTIARRDPLKPYSAKERVAEFERAFGDVERIEIDLLRTIERLDPGQHGRARRS